MLACPGLLLMLENKPVALYPSFVLCSDWYWRVGVVSSRMSNTAFCGWLLYANFTDCGIHTTPARVQMRKRDGISVTIILCCVQRTSPTRASVYRWHRVSRVV